MITHNPIDRFISYISPERGLKRTQSRMKSEMLREYQAAKKNRYNSDWIAVLKSSNDDVLGSIKTLAARSDDLIKNNPYAKRALTLLESTAIGSGIRVEFQDERINALWKRFSQKRTCDFENEVNFHGLQFMALKTALEFGDCIIRRRSRKPDEKNIFVTQYQLLPPEFLDHSYKERTQKGQIIGGVEYDDEGRKIAYHIWKYNPKDAVSDNKRVRIDAKDITLLRKREFLGQARGVPELSNSMLKLKDLSEYEFAQLLKQKISACHVDYITSNLEEDSSNDKNYDREVERIEPGTRKRLRPGEDIKTSNPPSVENYDTYVDKQLMAVASSTGVPFCLLSSEFRGMNYSSFRGAWLAFHKDIDVLRDYTIIPLACDPMVEWFIEDLKLIGIISKNWEYSYTSPRRELIDPTKEIPSLIASIRSGINSLPEVHRSLGKNSNEVLNEIARSNEILDELKLELDSDGRIKLKYKEEKNSANQKNKAK